MKVQFTAILTLTILVVDKTGTPMGLECLLKYFLYYLESVVPVFNEELHQEDV
jgi:hypothetical protein